MLASWEKFVIYCAFIHCAVQCICKLERLLNDVVGC